MNLRFLRSTALLLLPAAFTLNAGAATTLAHWDFETLTSGPLTDGYLVQTADLIEDLSGNGNHLDNYIDDGLQITDNVAPGNDTGSTLSIRGAGGNDASFAVNGDLDLGGSPVGSLATWTIEASVQLDSVSGWQTIVGRDGYGDVTGDAALSNLYLQKRGDNDGFRIRFTDNAGNTWFADSGTIAVAGQWYHLVATSDGSALRLFVNGTLEATTDISGSPDSAMVALDETGQEGVSGPAYAWSVGRGMFDDNRVDWVTGSIDDVRVSEGVVAPQDFLNSGALPGAVTYVDADAGNTTRWDGQPFNPAPEGNGSLDDNWELRTLGTNGDVYESNADGPEDAPLLVTTLNVSPNTAYVLYAYFWHDDRDWRLKASADAGDIDDNGSGGDLTDDFLPSYPLTHFSSTGDAGGTAAFAPQAAGTIFVSAPLLFEGNRTLRQASLGTAISNSGGELEVYIDDVAGVGEGNRTWYDGVGYKPALPLDDEADEDGDGLDNAGEASAGTDPYIVDTDGDTYSDGDEVAAGSDPLNPNSVPPQAGNAREIAPDGVWTWFNDERSIFHQGYLYSGYVKANGQYGLTRYDPETDTSVHTVISTGSSQQQDDHNNPSITPLPDGRLLLLYAKHLGGSQFYQRTSLTVTPATIDDWGDEITRPLSDNNTYNNTYILSEDGPADNRIYNFHRNINFNPTITYSNDLGANWTSVPFIEVGTSNVRPYPRYCSNHSDRVDLIYTDGHPRDENNSIYHMYYEASSSTAAPNGTFYKTDGTAIDTFGNLPLDHAGGQRGSVVYPYSGAAWGAGEGPDDWIPNARGWTWDVHYGADGNPVCVFQVQIGSDGGGYANSRIWYYYARWDGSQWSRKLIAKAGRGIYSAESDYGGGMTIDPENPNVVYISTNAAAPFDGLDAANIYDVPLRANNRYELYRGVTEDGGQTFEWEQLTFNSPADNLRPIVPENHGYDRTLVWFHGTYNSYTSYNARVLALLENELEIESYEFAGDDATIGWVSSPGRSYRIWATDNLPGGFTEEVASGVDSEGSWTDHGFTLPPPLQGSPRGFFRVEEE